MISNLLFWNTVRSALLSIVAGVWWQLLVSRPQYLPASAPLFAVVLLADRNFANGDAKYGAKCVLARVLPPLSIMSSSHLIRTSSHSHAGIKSRGRRAF